MNEQDAKNRADHTGTANESKPARRAYVAPRVADFHEPVAVFGTSSSWMNVGAMCPP